jgi:hypothetical protein
MRWLMMTDRELVPDMHYPHEHAAGGEVSLLMAIRPDLVDLGKTLETDGALADRYRTEPEHLARRATTPNRYIGVLTGVEDHSNDPERTASVERGRILLDTIAERLATRARDLLEE